MLVLRCLIARERNENEIASDWERNKVSERTNRKTLCGVSRKLSKTKSTLKPPSSSFVVVDPKIHFHHYTLFAWKSTMKWWDREKMFGIRMDKLDKMKKRMEKKREKPFATKRIHRSGMEVSERASERGKTEKGPDESSENHNSNTKIVNFRKSKVEGRWQTNRWMVIGNKYEE